MFAFGLNFFLLLVFLFAFWWDENFPQSRWSMLFRFFLDHIYCKFVPNTQHLTQFHINLKLAGNFNCKWVLLSLELKQYTILNGVLFRRMSNRKNIILFYYYCFKMRSAIREVFWLVSVKTVYLLFVCFAFTYLPLWYSTQ